MFFFFFFCGSFVGFNGCGFQLSRTICSFKKGTGLLLTFFGSEGFGCCDLQCLGFSGCGCRVLDPILELRL